MCSMIQKTLNGVSFFSFFLKIFVQVASADSQFNYDGSGFDLVHLHEGKTFCAGKPLFGFVVLEFKEDSCS